MWTLIMGLLGGAFNRAKMWLIAFGGLLVLVLTVFLKGRTAGKQVVIDKIANKREELRNEYDQIDAQRPDFDDAIGGLRDRARRRP